jgi:hypothetical protein
MIHFKVSLIITISIKLSDKRENISDFVCLTLNSKSEKKYYFEKLIIKDEFVTDSLTVYGEVLHHDGISLFAYRKIDITGYKVVLKGSRYKDIYTLENIFF